ncbi:hypothetical protein OC834_007467 [Tilletia horrida]|nr:hypothetical protein OC834_007467 [Tilletia horrida]
MAPVDVMHALDLGLCRFLWTETLINGGLLGDGDLDRCHKVIASIRYPSGVTKLSPQLGTKSGGTPTAHGWSVLSRYALPVILMSAWTHRSGHPHKMFKTSKRTVAPQALNLVASKTELREVLQLREHPRTRQETGQSSSPRSRVQTTTPGGLAHAPILNEAQIDRMHEHLSEFVKIMAHDIHPRWITYNGHIALHIADQIRLHGPARAYWSYPQERSYGLMKRIKTNRRRDGQIEATLLGRTDDRHRIQTVVKNLPSDRITDTVRAIVGEGDAAHAQALLSADSLQRHSRTLRLGEADLLAICSMSSRLRRPGDAPVAVMTHFQPGQIASMLMPTATRLDSLNVKGTPLRARTAQHAASSDPSACIVQHNDRLRVARFEHAFVHEYLEVHTGRTISRTYAIVHLLDPASLPATLLSANPLWQGLCFLPARPSRQTRVLVSQEAIISPAILLDGSQVTGEIDSVIATMF